MDLVCSCWWDKALWHIYCTSTLLSSGFWRTVGTLKLNGLKKYLMMNCHLLKGEDNQNVLGFWMTRYCLDKQNISSAGSSIKKKPKIIAVCKPVVHTFFGLCRGLTPVSSQAPHSHSLTPCPWPRSQWDGEENQERRQNSWVEIRTV